MSGRSLNVMGTGSTALLFTHLGTNRVGIGTNAPKAKLDVVGSISGSSITLSNITGNASSGSLLFAGAGGSITQDKQNLLVG